MQNKKLSENPNVNKHWIASLALSNPTNQGQNYKKKFLSHYNPKTKEKQNQTNKPLNLLSTITEGGNKTNQKPTVLLSTLSLQNIQSRKRKQNPSYFSKIKIV